MKELKEGKNEVPIESLPNWYYFNDEDDVEHDVTCIIGIPMGQPVSFGSILLLRFHKFKPRFSSRKETKTSPELLLGEMEKLLKNNQLERRHSVVDLLVSLGILTN